MNYPVWDVAFGAGLLMAIVSILHVFVSHFAVGGGLFLVLTERRARRTGDDALLAWLKLHTKFFVLVTVVFGAVSGVGIWFTIALINPTATANLIHAFVWGWAIEWVFFFLEITAALLYLYGWEKLDARLHEWYGWIYFANALASMVIINGILTFMLTPGAWITNHAFWSGFFNPTYFPSLLARIAIALALAGIYALLTAARQVDPALKSRLVRWSGSWILPSLAVLPACIWWYARTIPVSHWAAVHGSMPTATVFAWNAMRFGAATFLVALATQIKPSRLPFAASLLLAVLAFCTMGSFEFVREAVRKPFIIADYLYGNSLYAKPVPGDAGFTADRINQAGILATAKWVEGRTISPSAPARAGAEIFRVECQSCHTRDAYRGVRAWLFGRQWNKEEIAAMLTGLDLMHGGIMPPFAGTDSERLALAAWLDEVRGPLPPPPAPDGAAVFQRHCSVCHQGESTASAITCFSGMDAASIAGALTSLPAFNPRMPDLHLSDADLAALAGWIQTRAARP